MVAITKIAIIPLILLTTLSAKAETADHVIIWINDLMVPQDIAERIQQDPSFAVWQANTYLPQIDPTAIAAADSTTLPLDEESVTSFATAASNAVLSVSTSMYIAASNSAARSTGSQEYIPNFTGPRRDSIASFLGIPKAMLTYYIGTQIPYQITNDGKALISSAGAILSFVSDSARYTMQEYLKAYLINKKGFSEEAAGWLAFAASQTFGSIMTPVWAYATQVAMAPYFNSTTALRRLLIKKLNDDANNYVEYSNSYNYYMGLYYQTNSANYYNDAQQSLSSEQAYFINYNNAKAKLALYDSVAFPALSTSTVNQIHSLAVDPYPGYKNLPTTPADYTLMFDSIYNGFISRCDAISNATEQSVSITCPTASSLYRTRIYLKPLQQDANGNVTVEKLNVNGRGDAVLVGTWTINAKNIDTVNYH